MEGTSRVSELYKQGKELEQTFIKSYGEYTYEVAFGKVSNDVQKLMSWLENYSDIINNKLMLDNKSTLIRKIERAKTDPQFVNRRQFDDLLDYLQLIDELV